MQGGGGEGKRTQEEAPGQPDEQGLGHCFNHPSCSLLITPLQKGELLTSQCNNKRKRGWGGEGDYSKRLMAS